METRAYRFALRFVVASYMGWYQTTIEEKKELPKSFSPVDGSYSEFENSFKCLKDLGFSEIF